MARTHSEQCIAAGGAAGHLQRLDACKGSEAEAQTSNEGGKTGVCEGLRDLTRLVVWTALLLLNNMIWDLFKCLPYPGFQRLQFLDGAQAREGRPDPHSAGAPFNGCIRMDGVSRLAIGPVAEHTGIGPEKTGMTCHL